MQLAPSVRQLPVRFVGTGSEYFRIWIVNLLLTLVTLGLYYPRARQRKLAYFYGHTEIDGRPLAFHAEPRKMTRGFLFVAALFIVYSLASQASPLVANIGPLVIWGLWPVLWRSSLRFRMASTGWMGLRGRFTGSLREAYLAFWPFVLPAVAAALIGLMGDLGAGPATREALPLAMLALGLVSVVAVPLGLWRMRAYQQAHYAFGAEHSRFNVTPRAVYGVLLRTAALALGLLVLGGLGVFALGALGLFGGPGGTRADVGDVVVTIILTAVLGLLYSVIAMAILRGYYEASMQNLCWNGTRSANLRTLSRLSARALALLMLRNGVLSVLTGGLYQPFAAVATAKLRLEAVTLLSKLDTDALEAGARQHEEAAGDAMADALGVDMGL